MIISKYGVSLNNGKGFITWPQYREILKLFASDKIIESIMTKMNNITDYSSMEFEHLQDAETAQNIAQGLGLKPTKTLEGTKARIKKHLQERGTSTDMDTLIGFSMRYYAFANGLPLIDSLSLEWIMRTLKEFYADIGSVTIIDETNTIVKTLVMQSTRIEYLHGEPYLYLPTYIRPGYDTWQVSASHWSYQ